MNMASVFQLMKEANKTNLLDRGEDRNQKVALKSIEKELRHYQDKVDRLKADLKDFEDKISNTKMRRREIRSNFNKRKASLELIKKHSYLIIQEDNHEYWVACDHPLVDVEDESSKDYICASERHFHFEENFNHWSGILDTLLEIQEKVGEHS
tara:strand:+ start:555 stop:1013 length:459 start_codon:yes stop_codon:yes gene_type:complete